MNHLEDRIRRELQRAGKRIPESHFGARPQSENSPRPVRGPLMGIAAAATVLFVIGGVSFALLGGQAGLDSTSGDADGLRPATTLSETQGTAFDGVSDGCTPAVTRGTMYLGGPAWENNLAGEGFILSLPTGPTAIDLATTFVSQAIVGEGCDHQITASAESDLGDGRSAVAVDVAPPAAPVALHITVETAVKGDLIGVTAVRGATSFDVVGRGDVPILHFDALPAEAVNVLVRFRKGDDVWEVSASADDNEIRLAVPATETDRFPRARPDWVLFTVQDRDGAVVDVGGTLIP